MGTAVTDANGVATLSGVGVAGIGAGAHTAFVGAFFAGDATYAASTASGDLEVAAKPLTIAANNVGKTYGAPDPAFSVSYTGFVSGEGPANLGGSLQFTTTEASGGQTPVGTYWIALFGSTSSNYAITFVAGTLTVSRRR